MTTSATFPIVPKNDVAISEYLTVNQETGTLGDSVVQQHGVGIRFVDSGFVKFDPSVLGIHCSLLSRLEGDQQ